MSYDDVHSAHLGGVGGDVLLDAGDEDVLGYLGALAAGILGGIFSSPCSTPVLVVLLSIAAADGEAIRGGFLLLLYAVGCTALAVILGSSPAAIRKLGTKPAFRAVSSALNIILGILVLLIGLYMLYLGF